MTHDERVAAVASYAFTPRQAAFLTTVMLHAGVCVQRQYCAFAGIARGQVIRNFFAMLTTRGFATVYPCARRGAQVYHVHHKALYRAIGEPDSRCRRRASVERAIERLMVLDAVLMRRGLTWLATERDKVAYCLHQRHFNAEELPSLTFGTGDHRTTRYFADRLPIGVPQAGDELTFMYLVTEPTGRGCREFLEAHSRLLRRVSRWRLLLVVPARLQTAEVHHRKAVADFCAPPLRPDVLDEFRWYCTVRQSVDAAGARALHADVARYGRARRAFGTPRFYAAYREWLRDGDSAFGRLLSPALHESWRAQTISVETLVLPYVYAELSSLVQTA